MHLLHALVLNSAKGRHPLRELRITASPRSPVGLHPLYGDDVIDSLIDVTAVFRRVL